MYYGYNQVFYCLFNNVFMLLCLLFQDGQVNSFTGYYNFNTNFKRLKLCDSSLFSLEADTSQMTEFNRSHRHTAGNRGIYSSFMTSIISFMPSRKPCENISRSVIVEMSAIYSLYFSKIFLCSSERLLHRISSFFSANSISL